MKYVLKGINVIVSSSIYFILACSSTRTKTDAHSLQSPFHMCLTKKGLCSIDMGAKLNKLMYTTNLDAATGHLA